ncbi:MAG: hypothetical protein A2922_00320 [Candidatus Nealsonbacteria bacterium RIFCSPLOWO2_01_FULL_43_36]|uniref:Uncharacterized protein n=1 Tax=Candidatus Nealsonbacteria bacterium RIFCSPHIGHO2_02_FULL_43_13 TaxID=1801668 RepID=A0A1G2E915_9BACT|nr:MAG: hypothetical protein A3D46_01435 [Candidatus Nealsonbacteria bacterium RIFCSPHIGHO2_02_FULL_43_13]OGZ24698.1 MAG: hypothetical protein A2922_00320 [Candidatus Nealsonbacteria bacterium RIFCSPLOWO2_01_FULL_43_36]
MKKVLAQLFLISFLAVLVVPAVVSAGIAGKIDCQNQCVTPSVDCNCGGANGDYIGATTPMYCLNGVRFNSNDNGEGRQACLAVASGGTTGSGTSVTTVKGLLNKIDEISGYIRTGLFGIAGIFLIIAGYYFVTGGGEPEKLTKARQMLINALIGVAIAVAATGLVGIVKDLVK